MLGVIFLMYVISILFIGHGIQNMPKKSIIETEVHPRIVELRKNPL